MIRRAVRAPWIAVALLVAPAAAHRVPAAAQPVPGWEVRVAERVVVAAGATAVLALGIAVDRGLTVSRDADVIVDLDAEPGIAIKKKRLGRRDAVDPEADAPRFAVNVRGDQPGEHRVRLHVRFWLCGTRTCWPIDVRRVATVVVGDVAPPP